MAYGIPKYIKADLKPSLIPYIVSNTKIYAATAEHKRRALPRLWRYFLRISPLKQLISLFLNSGFASIRSRIPHIKKNNTQYIFTPSPTLPQLIQNLTITIHFLSYFYIQMPVFHYYCTFPTNNSIYMQFF